MIKELLLILSTAFIATASPGVSTLAIASVAMGTGRKTAMMVAAGIITGSVIWCSSAAIFMSTLVDLDIQALKLLRYFGAAYLVYLGYLCFRAGINSSGSGDSVSKRQIKTSEGYIMGLLIHLTNPKVILFFLSLFSILSGDHVTRMNLIIVVVLLGIQSTVIFVTYALIFSSSGIVKRYQQYQKVFNFIVGFIFIVFAIGILLD